VQQGKKRTHRHRQEQVEAMLPIGQALAPYLPAGCCAVIGLVPHALCIGVFRHIYDSRYTAESRGNVLLFGPKKGLTNRRFYDIMMKEALATFYEMCYL